MPLTLDTLRIIAPYALAMALVGILESLLTAKLVDDITDTHSDKTREAWGQGAANVITGFFGGMGGCAMIGQTMINVKASGARTRLSTFLAGVFLLILVVGFGDVVALIPMAALVAVMIMVSVGTFDWHSVQPATLRRMPKSETTVMVATVVVTVATHNLAIGVVVGVLVAMTLFARRVAHLTETHRELVEDTRRQRHRRLPGHRRAVLRLQQRPLHPVRLRRRPRPGRHRPLRLPHLGRLHRRLARRHHDQVRAQGQDGEDHRPQRRQRRPARAAVRTARDALNERDRVSDLRKRRSSASTRALLARERVRFLPGAPGTPIPAGGDHRPVRWREQSGGEAMTRVAATTRAVPIHWATLSRSPVR